MHSHLSPPNSPFSPPPVSFLCAMDGEGSLDLVVQNLVLKRKRSQRQRPWNSSSSEDDEEEEEHQAARSLMLLTQGKYHDGKSQSEKKINVGLYQCKTCYRSFQSFQALGGHRTSHKKMKIKSEELSVPIGLRLGTSRTASIIRVHECLICNAVFASGQALGGHMRRHRVTVSEGQTSTETETKSDNLTLSLHCPATGNETCRSDNDFQCLDLNFPVAAADVIGESQFCFGAKQPKQQPQLEDSGSVLFSSPALVNCHY